MVRQTEQDSVKESERHRYKRKILILKGEHNSHPEDEENNRPVRTLGSMVRPGLFLKNSITEIPYMLMQQRRLKRDPIFSGEGVPKFDNKPVVLIPGLAGFKMGIGSISGWLEKIGCKTFRAGLTPKQLTPDLIMKKIDEAVDEAYRSTGKKPVLVGYSLGGLEAVFYANRHPDKVERVITICSPKTERMKVNFLLDGLVWGIASLWTGRKTMAEFLQEAVKPSKVPISSLYSKQDGVVNWKDCIIPGGDNREVDGSHLSMLLNAGVYKDIAGIMAG